MANAIPVHSSPAPVEAKKSGKAAVTPAVAPAVDQLAHVPDHFQEAAREASEAGMVVSYPSIHCMRTDF